MKKKSKFIHIPNSEFSNVNSWIGSDRGKDIVWNNRHKLEEYQKKLKLIK